MLYHNLSIGLFGGSFNPAHEGHLHVATSGLNMLALDQVWWMVSPQNPLKPEQPSYESRLATVMALNLPSRMYISHMEREFQTRYTVDTLLAARKRWPTVRFVFLMGADNFQQLPQWKNWHHIMQLVPIAIIARPARGTKAIKARLGKAARIYANARVSEYEANMIAYRPAPAWTYLTTPLNSLSSTAIRRARLKE